MIATGLVFLLGVLVALLAAILLAPLLWRKAQSFARRDVAATLPASANEIRAEFDRVRAEAAMTMRRGEVAAAEARERMARSQAELGRTTVENAKLLKRVRRQEEEIEALKAEIETLRESETERLVTLDETRRELEEARRAAELTAEELEALGTRYEELSQVAEARQAGLEAAERAAAAPPPAPSPPPSPLALAASAFASALRPKDAAPKPVPAKPAAAASPDVLEGSPEEVRERILEIAAHAIHVTALAEGRGSPLASLLSGPTSPADGPPFDLADRVRRLAASGAAERERPAALHAGRASRAE